MIGPVIFPILGHAVIASRLRHSDPGAAWTVLAHLDRHAVGAALDDGTAPWAMLADGWYDYPRGQALTV